MALDALDHYLLNWRQAQHQHWLEQQILQTRELQQALAEQAAANQGRKAIIDALVAAYQANDWQAIQSILGDYEQRRAIYQTAYFPTLNSMKPA